MIEHDTGCRLTASDHRACRRLLRELEGTNSPMLPLMRAKLRAAGVMAEEESDPLAASINSRIEFQVDGAAPEPRILVAGEFRNGLVGLTLPLSTPFGLALLGVRQGDGVCVEVDGRRRRLVLVRIAYQAQTASPLRAVAGPRRMSGASSIIDLATVRDQRSIPFRRKAR